MTAAPQAPIAATRTARPLRLAALTSYSTEPLREKILALATAGIHLLDLYCFCERDLEQLFPGPAGRHPFDHFVQYFRPDIAARKIQTYCHEAERAAGSKEPVQIIGISTFLPDVASPVPELRQNAVASLKLLLQLARALRALGFWCETIELVTGYTIAVADPPALASSRAADRLSFRARISRTLIDLLKWAKGAKISPPIFMRAVPPAAALGFLLDSLGLVLGARDAESWPTQGASAGPPLLACELEPSLGRLVHDEVSLNEFLTHSPGLPGTGFNLDLGHMEIAGVDHGIMAGLGGRCVHVHVSNNASEHFADLAMDAAAGYKPAVFQDWLTRVHQCWRAGGSLYRGGLSIEIESCGDVRVVQKSYQIIAGWLDKLGIGYV